jgi:Uma2 family endonuclease
MPKEDSITQEERPLGAREAGIKENWLRALDTYRVRFLVLNLQSESDMVKYFRSQPGWLVDFQDEESIIFARTDAPAYALDEIPIAA